jgi:hypothetical protein
VDASHNPKRRTRSPIVVEHRPSASNAKAAASSKWPASNSRRAACRNWYAAAATLISGAKSAPHREHATDPRKRAWHTGHFNTSAIGYFPSTKNSSSFNDSTAAFSS